MRREHEVLCARDGGEALALLAAHPVDVLIIDMEMPVLSGRDVCERVRADPALRGIGVIVLTGSEIEGSATSLGADVLLRKPSGVSRVVPSVEMLLARRHIPDNDASVPTEAAH